MLAKLKQIGWGALFGVLISGQVFGQTATLLPNAKQQFFSDTGTPLASGTVDFYIPSTNTRKTTWNSSTESSGTQNPNPVVLDAAGRALIYGDGSYRQVVKDQNGNTIWDAVTASTGGGSGGTSPAWSEGVMVGTIIPWANVTLPAKYLYTAGQAISRTTYPDLFTALTFQATILCQVGIATLAVSTDISDKMPIGGAIEASCFAPGTTVIAKSSGQLTLSSTATTTLSTTATLFPWGDGNGSTTFNVPDLRGRAIAGRDNMSNTAGRLTTAYFGTNPDAINAAGGSQTFTLTSGYLPPRIPAGSVSTSLARVGTGSGFTTSGTNVGYGGTSSGGSQANIDTLLTATSTFTGYPYGGGVAASAALVVTGSGYTNGTQLLTVSGGTCTTQPQFNVTVSGGVPSSPVLFTAGSCTSPPSNPAATTGGGGSGATLNVTYTTLPFSLVQPSLTADYIIKALPDDLPSGPGVTSIQGMTGAITCGGNLVCTANTISVNISPGVLSLGGMTGVIACGANVTCAGNVVSVATPAPVYNTATELAAASVSPSQASLVTLGKLTSGDFGGATYLQQTSVDPGQPCEILLANGNYAVLNVPVVTPQMCQLSSDTDAGQWFNRFGTYLQTHQAKGLIPSISYNFVTPVVWTAPTLWRTRIDASGATFTTTGAIYAFKITGGAYSGGMDLINFHCDHQSNATALGCFVILNAGSITLTHPEISCGGTSASYTGIYTTQSVAADPNTGAFWTNIDDAQIYSLSGTRCEFGIFLEGASNATRIRGGQFATGVYGVRIQYLAASLTQPNSVLIDGVAFEDWSGAAVSISGNGTGGVNSAPQGLRIVNSRFENVAVAYQILGGINTTSAQPTFVCGNSLISATNYINNAGTPIVTQSCDSPTSLDGTLSMTGTSQAVTFPIAQPSARYTVTLTGTSNVTLWASALGTGGFTVNSSASLTSQTIFWHVAREAY